MHGHCFLLIYVGSALDHGDLTHKSVSAVYTCQRYFSNEILYIDKVISEKNVVQFYLTIRK